MTAATINVGLIGYGFAGQVFHAPLLRTTPGLAIGAVASRNPDKVRADLGGVAVHAEPALLLADPAVDLVVLASPNPTHFPLARAALEAGKHVVVDKPFTDDARQAAELVRLAEDKGLLLSVYHNRRWDSTTRTALRLLADGTLGPVRHAAMHFDRFRPQPQARWKEELDAGGGIWMDLGPHLLDEAVLYFGAPLAIEADLPLLRPGSRCEDQFQARLRYADGLRVDLGASMVAAVARPRVALHGLAGSWVKQSLDPQEADLIAGRLPAGDAAAWGVDKETGTLAVLRDGQLATSILPTENGAYPAYYAGIRDALLGKAPNPVPAREALTVMRLLDAGRRSAAERREILLSDVSV
ncbi:oxidoreductase [Massilia rhizosphaerae]|uniref:oxidoreductase n=1 Tax=Massilia rhizosphaerae TaxID=2784389 RepID=UPI0018DD52D8|nr:oxidoreductase [Massilia rhizosphaerae]